MTTLIAPSQNGVHGDHPDPIGAKPTAPDYLSPSSVRDYLGCSLRYYFRKVEGLPDTPSLNMVLGRAVHAGIQAHYLDVWRGGQPDREGALAAYHEVYLHDAREHGLQDDPDHDVKQTKGQAMLEAYLDSDHCRDTHDPVAVEVALRDAIPGFPVAVAGQVDLVRRASSAGVVPVDFKTIANQPDTEMEGFLHETQTVLYQILVEAATGERVAGREIVFITKHKSPRVVVHEIPRASPEAVQRVRRMVEYAYSGIRMGRWSPQPGTACAWCSFRQACRDWTGKGVNL